MALYLLKSAACLAFLFLFYKLFLEKEQMHIFKRFYLLGSLVVAFIIPLITFSTYIDASEGVSTIFISERSASETPDAINYLPTVLWSIYLLGLLFFSLKFFRNLSHLILKIRRNPKIKINRIINVLLKESIIPHTFFSFIFLNKEKYTAHTIPEAILIHEEAHANQKHSLDTLLIEVLQIVFWFNPFLYFIKHSIKLNHEFLADRAVLNNGVTLSKYQNLLIACSSNAQSPQLANSINYSSIKKRLTVMKTHTSPRRAMLRVMVILPLLALLIFGFSTKEIVLRESSQVSPANNQVDASQEKIATYNKMAAFWNTQFAKTNNRIIPLSELKKLESIYREMTDEQKAQAEPFPECELIPKVVQDKATPDQVTEYNKLAKKYNSQDVDNRSIIKNEVDRLKYLYGLLSPEQRKNAELFPNILPPPKAPNSEKAPKPAKPVKAPKAVIDADAHIAPTPPPPPPPATKISNRENEEEGMAPPPPPIFSQEPLDHIIRMADENAAFFYEGEKISSEKAIELLKNNKNLNIETTTFKASNPIVNITAKGATIKK